MLSRIRQGALFYLLIVVAGTAWLAQDRKRSWDEVLWISIYPINGDGQETTSRYLAGMSLTEFRDIEPFLSNQAERHAMKSERMVRINLGPELSTVPPTLNGVDCPLKAAWWSLQTRLWALRATWDVKEPTPDIRVFAIFHDGDRTPILERSAGLAKGHIAVANLFADRRMRGANQVVVTHELLHTLGATDKYDPTNNQPLFPIGYAQPDRDPLFPQRWAEIMAGRIPVSAESASIPDNLNQTIVGQTTAREIGWLR